MTQTLSSPANHYDVIIIGGGHAGVEAAYASARKGAQTLLITIEIDRIGWMPCNPAIGGVGKGHIVFEIAAFDGCMPQAARSTYLQARMLNTSRGPAVQGLRVQIDKYAYSRTCKKILQEQQNLTIIENQVQKLLIENNTAVGAITTSGEIYTSTATVITTGVFLNSCTYIGTEKKSSGYLGSPSSDELAKSIYSLGLKMGRLKTGTPPRLLRSSIDFSKMEMQECDPLTYLFEFDSCTVHNTHDCYITHTNKTTNDSITSNFHLSPLFSGAISGTSPRYCPSIELKVLQFASKDSHHIFVEPESAANDEIYPNGLSTSLPLAAQQDFINTISGFENAIITQAGYAIEYDFVHPTELSTQLEVKKVKNLFLAGQINGTTGYEEAGGQGLVAGINAAARALNEEPLVLNRYESYIGIMIDDLVTCGIDEPYRMFTSRAEHRLIMRQDNTFERLAAHAHKHRLITNEKYARIQTEATAIHTAHDLIIKTKNKEPFLALMRENNHEQAQELLTTLGQARVSSRALISIYAEVLYGPYKEREIAEIKKFKSYQTLTIPETFEYHDIPGLSNELQQKLTRTKPATIAQASLIQGMTPAGISLLIFKIRQQYGLL